MHDGQNISWRSMLTSTSLLLLVSMLVVDSPLRQHAFGVLGQSTNCTIGYEPDLPFPDCDIRRTDVLRLLFTATAIQSARLNGTDLSTIDTQNFTLAYASSFILSTFTSNTSTSASILIPSLLVNCTYGVNGTLYYSTILNNTVCGCLSSCGELYQMSDGVASYFMINTLRDLFVAGVV